MLSFRYTDSFYWATTRRRILTPFAARLKLCRARSPRSQLEIPVRSSDSGCKPHQAQEFSLVSNLRSLSGPALRKSSFLLAPALLAGLCASAHAQTAPQLLPYTVKLIAGNGTAAIAAGATCPVS